MFETLKSAAKTGAGPSRRVFVDFAALVIQMEHARLIKIFGIGAPGATPMSQNQTCAQGLQKTPQEWGNLVRNSYPGYTGRRPRMQITHGLADGLVRPQCAYEALKQWSNVLGIEFTRDVSGVPSSQWTQKIYGDGTKLQGFFGQGVGHAPSVNEQQLLKFFGLTN
jgi:hypothetical protein